ncbi:MAG TPA: energy transducer TonB [Anaerohalosphaeraceae bacterium]|nr:energy transducer TonB [Anaerohalosphaeraceae bacterium]HOL89371.1 energy transducer TonB [Anaerohalosphaeraceae bacterium]
MRALFRWFWKLFHRLAVLLGGIGMTLLFFLILPLMQTLAKPPAADLILRPVDTAKLDAPPPPPEEKPPQEPDPEDKPPELTEEAPPLTLEQLTLALNPSLSGSWMEGDFAVSLQNVAAETKNAEAPFSIADLDQKPRVIYQSSPLMTKELRKKTPGTVYIIFVVDEQGRVENPTVQSSTDPIFEKPALNAVKQWKFEPGRRNGQPVKFRMRVPITFPKG